MLAQTGKRRLLIVDNARWDKDSRLCWHYFNPAHGPDFNPMERLWLRLKAEFIAHTSEEVSLRPGTALCHFMEQRPIAAAQCAFRN